MKTHRIKVSYSVTLTHYEYKRLVALGREWGFQGKPLHIAKQALRNSGDSGCLSLIPTPTSKPAIA